MSENKEQGQPEKTGTGKGSAVDALVMPVKKPFCFNEECDFNGSLVKDNIHFIDQDWDNGIHRINRHVYVNRAGNKIYLCEICHGAIVAIDKEA